MRSFDVVLNEICAFFRKIPRPPSFHQVNSVENLPTEMKTGSDGACAALVCLYLPCLLAEEEMMDELVHVPPT